MTQPAFITLSEAAGMIGVSSDTLRRRMATFQEHGFPERNRVVNKYPRQQVEAFIARQTGESDTFDLSDDEGVNTDAFS
jgi:DNA-binding Lrp family transcriptional regulator